MSAEKFSNMIFKELAFSEHEDCLFFTFLDEGNKEDILGLEKFPHLVNATGMCICLEGEATVLIGSQNYRFKKGDMCVVLPNTILHTIEKSKDYKGFMFAFRSDLLYNSNIPSGTPLFMYVKENPCISITEEQQNDLIKICNIIQGHDLRNEHPYKKEITNYLIGIAIYEVLGLYKESKTLKQQSHSQKKIYYFRFIELLSKYSGKHITTDFYANELCITPRYLSSICKEIIGHTATECINSHILMNARLLLITTNKTVAQISEELNFSNTSFFTQFFKKHEGITPKTYRARNSKEES
jgi:AraC-like DNA-binding protein